MALPATEPNWASDTNFSTGPESGTATKVSPGAGALAQGFVPGANFVGPYINYVLYWLCQHATYVRNLTSEALTWTAAHIFSSTVTCNNTLTSNSTVTFNSTLGVGGHATFDTATFGDIVTAQETLSCTKATGTGLAVTANATVGGTLAVTSTSTFTSAATFTGGAIANNDILMQSGSEISYGSGGSPTYRTRAKIVPLVPVNATGAGNVVQTTSNSFTTYFNFSLPKDCELVSVQSVVRSTSAVHTGPSIEVFNNVIDTAGPGATTATSLGTATGAADSTAHQLLTATAGSPTAQTADNWFTLAWTSSTDASSNDYIYSIQVTFRDYGPRND